MKTHASGRARSRAAARFPGYRKQSSRIGQPVTPMRYATFASLSRSRPLANPSRVTTSTWPRCRRCTANRPVSETISCVRCHLWIWTTSCGTSGTIEARMAPSEIIPLR